MRFVMSEAAHDYPCNPKAYRKERSWSVLKDSEPLTTERVCAPEHTRAQGLYERSCCAQLGLNARVRRRGAEAYVAAFLGAAKELNCSLSIGTTWGFP